MGFKIRDADLSSFDDEVFNPSLSGILLAALVCGIGDFWSLLFLNGSKKISTFKVESFLCIL